MHLKIKGIVLSQRKVGDSDAYITVFTNSCGVISAYAKGARKLRSKLSACCEVLCYGEYELFESKGRYIVDSGEIEQSFFGLRCDVEKLALGLYFASLSEELTRGSTDNTNVMKLFLNTLYMLEQGRRTKEFLKSVFEFRMASITGYSPSIVACENCGVFESDKIYFHVEDGAIRCEHCGSRDIRSMPINKSMLSAIRHIVFSEPDKLFSFSLSAENEKWLQRLSEVYIVDKLERIPKSLRYYNQLTMQK